MMNSTLKKLLVLLVFGFSLIASQNLLAQPANDDACNAAVVTVDDLPVLVSPMGATAQVGEDTLLPPQSGNCLPHTWCDPAGITRSTWYKFTVPASGAVQVSICGSNFDSQLAAYRVGNCADFLTYTFLDASDDAGADPGGVDDCGPSGFAGWFDMGCLTPGEEIYLLVDLWSSDTTTNYAVDEFASVEVASLAAAGPAVIDSISVVPPGCQGLSDGRATLNFQATFPWNIVWGNGQTTQTATGLSAGTVSVTISDFCGTTASSTMSVPDGPPAVPISLDDNAAYVYNPAGCNNLGQLTAKPVTGIAPFNYAWSNGATTPSVTGLVAGDYTVTVGDACGGTPTVQNYSIAPPTVTNTAGDDKELCGGSVVIGPSTVSTNAVDMVTYSTQTPEGNVACRGGGFIAQNSYFRPFELDSFFGLSGNVDVKGLEIFYVATPAAGFGGFIPGVEFALLSADNVDLTVATMTELQRVSISLPRAAATRSFRVPFNVSIDAGTVLVVEATINAATADGHTFDFRANSTLPAGATPTYLTSTSCGIGSPTATGSIGFPDDHLLANLFVSTSAPDFSFNWFPAVGLSDATVQNPSATILGTYAVTITDNTCGTSTEDNMLVTPCTGIVNPSEHTFAITPNPSSGLFRIQNDGEVRDMHVVVHDVQGKEIMNRMMNFHQNEQKPLDLSNFQSGIYFLQLTHDDATEVHRLVVSK